MSKKMRYAPGFYLTVDIVLLTVRAGQLSVLLVRRRDDPYRGAWALPGGFVQADEEVESAARRELAEETGVKRLPAGMHMEQLKLYAGVGRDPRGRVASSAWVALAPKMGEPKAGSDAAEARWWAVEDLEGEDAPVLAFDHKAILADGLERVRAKLEYTTVAAAFTDEVFTISDLRRVYAAVWGQQPERSAFHELVLANPGFVTPVLGKATPGTGGGRPAQLYRRGKAFWLVHPLARR